MTKIYDTVAVTIGTTVAIGGTFTASYPAGKSGPDYLGGDDHLIVSGSAPALFSKEGDFTIAYGASLMTVSILRGRGFTAGDIINLNLDRAAIGPGEEFVMANPLSMVACTLIRITPGKPIASAANGFHCEANGAFGEDEDAAIALYGEPSSSFITNTEIVSSAGDGIGRAWSGAPTDFLATNTFTSVAECNQSFPRDANGACPANSPCR